MTRAIKKAWKRPELVRLGTIESVQGSTMGMTQNFMTMS